MKLHAPRMAAVCLALAVLFVSCPSPLSNATMGTIRLSFTGASRGVIEPRELVDPTLAIKTLLVDISGPGMERLTSQPVAYDTRGTALTMSVPAGLDRAVTISARNEAGTALYSQTQTVAIVAGKELRLSFNLDGVLYSVSFDANGGSGTMAPQSIAYGSKAALTPNGFARAGYTFGGWSLTAGGAVTFADNALYAMGAGSVTLYAVWSVIIGQYIQGDGSGGGGGGASGAYLGGTGGEGGGGDDTITGTAGNDVIFGDGSGGGKGGRGVGMDDVTGTGAGLGGGGADSINAGTGDDIIFGDGFNGTMDQWNAGKGGFGGGGGGGSGGNLGTYLGAIGGLGAGCGSGYAGSVAPLVAGFGITGGSGTTPGGNSATSSALATGPGGASYGPGNGHGGGGGFGGGSGGAGASTAGPGNPGQDGNTDEHRYDDSTGSIHAYVLGRLATILTDYPAYGAGNDVLDGGPGSDHLFGLGGADTFVFELDDAYSGNDIDTIWDFNVSGTDKLSLKTGGTAIDATLRDALIAAQVTEGADRKLVFSNQADKQVTIVIKNLGRAIVASDFAQ